MGTFDELLEHVIQLKVGDKFHAVTPLSAPESRLIHIDHMLESKNGNIIYLYSFYGNRKRMWFEAICSQFDMALYIERFKKLNT